MGSVAILAASYLLSQLGARTLAELNAQGIFELQSVQIKNGLVLPDPLPKSMFFEWKDPRGNHDLLLFLGESQPVVGGHHLCQRIIEFALQRGVQRVITFAAMATQLQMDTKPQVWGAATDQATLQELESAGVEVLSEGKITGLNGVLLAAGSARQLPGLCLLGELPFFAAAMPNPRAAVIVLERFARLANIPLDLTDLIAKAEAVDQQLANLLHHVSKAIAPEETPEDDLLSASRAEPEPPQPRQPPALDPKIQQHIETLFEQTLQDHSKALELKQELDRLGVFKQYENRFLDLFRKAE
jgi:proteasome assembly chaperone (PAC2) family protein